MSLPSPNLDDRTFQQIVDDVKRQIGRRCPEWSDHNVSDPGVTLIELFAWMTEMSLYRMNQVPEKNYRKFLELIGVTLEPPAPARTDLRFWLSRPIEDEDGEEAFERLLPAARPSPPRCVPRPKSLSPSPPTPICDGAPPVGARSGDSCCRCRNQRKRRPAGMRNLESADGPFSLFSVPPRQGRRALSRL